jgi:redox-sensitive bicupin YhaK (pirin superfamily)
MKFSRGIMDKIRQIRKIIIGRPVMEGAGVHLTRIFGSTEVPLFDPFLMLDDFRSSNHDHYMAGFPWHPHRGIETITYVLKGDVEHGDSMGNKGVISSGDMQWMTAGSGIVHQEMPHGDNQERLEGFQLWANLPKSHKMMEPRYQEIRHDQIPEISLENGVKIKIICGKIGEHESPVKEIIIDPEYLDVSIPAQSRFSHNTKQGHTVFAYIIEGKGYFEDANKIPIGNGNLCLYEDGEQVSITTSDELVRFLLISGKPIGETVAWRGPIVMNTNEELDLAFEEYQKGTFIKHKKA